MKKWLLAAAAAGLLAAGAVFAQIPSLLLASPTGLEQIEVIIPSSGGIVTAPQKVQVTINQLRNAAGYLLQATGTTINTTVPNTASRVLATGAITTWNVTLPTAPFDGQMVEVACPGGTASTVSMAATAPSGVTIVGTAFTSCTSGGAAANTAEWIYSLSANVWYRIQ